MAGLGRLLDIGSTYYASRSLALESNLLAKKLGWKGILVLNITLCFVFAIDYYISLMLLVVSALAAGNNLEKAWVPITVGEKEYSEIFKDWVKKAEAKRLFFSNFAGGSLFFSIGLLLIFLSIDFTAIVIGLAFTVYASAIIFHRSLAFYKIRKQLRNQRKQD